MANDPTTRPAPPPVAPATPAAPAPPPAPARKSTSFLTAFLLGASKPGEIVVFHHSNLFYWWPVWAFGYIMAVVTYFTDMHMAIVPAGTIPLKALHGEAESENTKIDLKDRAILVLAEGKGHLTRKDASGQERIVQPHLYVADQKSIGTVYLFILLLVIAITNIHLRGMWSFFVLIVIVALAFIFAAAGWWENIFSGLGNLSVHINMGGYLLLSTVLFILWIVNFWIMDRQTYVVFSAGQVRMRLEIGGGETVYDTTGMVIQKQRGDLFRHWILGFGSGDLIIKPVGVTHPIELPNVLQVGHRVRQIEKLVKEKVVVA